MIKNGGAYVRLLVRTHGSGCKGPLGRVLAKAGEQLRSPAALLGLEQGAGTRDRSTGPLTTAAESRGRDNTEQRQGTQPGAIHTHSSAKRTRR